MTEITVLGLVVLTSAATYRAARVRLGLSRQDLPAALGRALDVMGTSVVFFAVNLAVGVGVIIALRVLTGTFVSIYLLDDVSLLLLSCVQGLVFDGWRRA